MHFNVVTWYTYLLRSKVMLDIFNIKSEFLSDCYFWIIFTYDTSFVGQVSTVQCEAAAHSSSDTVRRKRSNWSVHTLLSFCTSKKKNAEVLWSENLGFGGR